MPAGVGESTFLQSLALLDAEGRLVSWDAGFENEFAAATSLIGVGARFAMVAEAAFRIEGARRAATMRPGAAGSSFRYRDGARTIEVDFSPAPAGGCFRMAKAHGAEAPTGALSEGVDERWRLDGDPTFEAAHEFRVYPDGGRSHARIGPDVQRLWGLSEDDYDPEDVAALLSRMVQTTEEAERFQGLLEQMLTNHAPVWWESPVRGQDGRLRWIRMSFTAQTLADGSSHIINRMRDVTREKLADDQVELLRSAVEHATDAIQLLKTRADGRLATVYVNRAFEALSGWPAGELIGDSGKLKGGWEGGYWAPVLQAAPTRPGQAVEFQAARRDGGEIWVEASAKIVRRREDGSADWVVVSRNVDERRRAQQELLQAKEAAEKASLVKSEFLANMSHEIRTPLNGVLGMTSLLLAGPLNAQQRAYARAVEQSGETLLTILNDILDISKLEAGKIELEAIDFDLGETVEASLRLLAPIAAAKDLELRVEVEPAARVRLLGDPTRLRQILTNLAGNGLKFTPHGRVAVRVARLKGPADRAQLRFEVDDTGVGMDEAACARLFQKFSQADSSITRRYGGTGLGLAICRQLVELMGGRIGVRSRPDEGSTFWFELGFPFAAVETPASPRAADNALGAEAGPSLRILLAEDHKINQQFALAVLAAGGHEVDLAENGFEAIEAVERVDYDVVLMDIQMPRCGGLEATQRIRAMAPPKCDVPIIALTADAMSGSKDQYVKSGMDDYLSKPVKPAELLAKLARIRSDVGVARAASVPRRKSPTGAG